MGVPDPVADLGQEITRLNLTLQRLLHAVKALTPAESEPPASVASEVSPVFPGARREEGGIVFASHGNLQVGPGQTILIPDFVPTVSGTGELLVSSDSEVGMELLVHGVARAANQGYPIPAGQWFAFDFPMVREVPYNIRFDRIARVSIYGLLVVR